jgi:hypothetical protein
MGELWYLPATTFIMPVSNIRPNADFIFVMNAYLCKLIVHCVGLI